MSKTQSRQSVWQGRVNPNMRRKAHKIIDSFSTVNRYSTIELCAALHLYVKNEISYEKRGFASGNPRAYRPPEEVWRIGGNCGERSILLASLMCSVEGAKTRTIGLSREGEDIGHRLLEIKFPYHPEDVIEVLKNFYARTNRYSIKTSDFVWESHAENKYTWMISDPGMSRHLGDKSGLENTGYLDPSEDSWDWYQLDDKYHL